MCASRLIPIYTVKQKYFRGKNTHRLSLECALLNCPGNVSQIKASIEQFKYEDCRFKENRLCIFLKFAKKRE